jgi:hypothetical protein
MTVRHPNVTQITRLYYYFGSNQAGLGVVDSERATSAITEPIPWREPK